MEQLDLLILCTPCRGEHRKATRVEEHGGLISFPLQKLSSCQKCRVPAASFTLCIACAIELGLCQQASTKCRGAVEPLVDQSLRDKVSRLRIKLEALRTSAQSEYERLIAAYKEAAAQFESETKAADSQLNADALPLDEARRRAWETYNASVKTGAYDQKLANEYSQACRDYEEGCAVLLRDWNERKSGARSQFKEIHEYLECKDILSDRIISANSSFLVAVNRLYGHFLVERSYKYAIESIELRERFNRDVRERLKSNPA